MCVSSRFISKPARIVFFSSFFPHFCSCLISCMLAIGRCFQSRCPWKGEMPELMPAPLPCFLTKAGFRHVPGTARALPGSWPSQLSRVRFHPSLVPQFWGSALSPELLGSLFQQQPAEEQPPTGLPCGPQGPRPGVAHSPQCLRIFGWAWFQPGGSGEWLKTHTFFSFLPLKSKARFLYFFPRTS